jgi:hypothetical protein
MRQDDGHSCGPIACLKIMSVFGRISTHITDTRQMIVDDFKQLLDELNDDIRVNVPKGRKKDDKSVSMINTVSNNPLDGLVPPKKQSYKPLDACIASATADDGITHQELGPQTSSTSNELRSDEQRSKSLARITTDREAAQTARTELRLLTASKMVKRSGVLM